jgi:hypothetical protein
MNTLSIKNLIHYLLRYLKKQASPEKSSKAYFPTWVIKNIVFITFVFQLS